MFTFVTNTYFKMIKWSVFLFLVISIHHISFSQRTITTRSGQRILLQDGEKWQKIVIDQAATDTLSVSTNDESPSDSAVVVEIAIDPNALMVDKILDKAYENEVEAYIAVDDLNKALAMKELVKSQAKISKDKTTLNDATREIKELKNAISDAEKKYKNSSAEIESIKEIHKLNASSQEKSIVAWATKYNIPLDGYFTTPAIDVVPEKKVNPKCKSCTVSIDEKRNKKRYIETEPIYIFNHTPEKLKNYFKEKELMEAKAAVVCNDGAYFIKLTIKIISKDAAKNYGMIQKDNMLRLNFISGKNVILHAASDVNHILENYTGHSIYNILYPVSRENLSFISNLPIDTMGIMWSSGFETYEVFEVDVLMNALTCVKSL